MDSHHRKLLEEPPICGSCVKDCTPSFCAILCSNECASNDPYIIPPPSPPISSRHKHSTVLIIIMVIIGASFLSICIYGFYTRNYNNSRRSNSSSQPDHQTRQEFLDEEHASTVKYRMGDGVVEGTECSVCLNEFQEDESLRLLPKCSHAFHIPCIDTWLRSHTNCPMCRDPIVINSVIKNSLPEPSGVHSGSEEETERENLENNGENDMRMDRQDVTVKDLNMNSTHETSSVNSSQNNFASSSSSNNGQHQSPQIKRVRSGL